MTDAVMTTVGAVLQRIEAGRSTQTLERPAQDGELGILRVSAVTWGEFRPGENKAMPLDYDPGNVPRPVKGDILITRANTRELVGAPVMVEADYPNLLLSDKILRLVPDCNIVEPRYLLRALRSSAAASHFSQCAGGTSGSMTNITQGDIRATPLRLPSLSEQRRIAAILDKADALRAKRREAIAKLRQLLQSVFLEMFGDPVTNPKGWPLGSMLSLTKGKYGIKAGPFGSALKKEFYTPTGYRIYGQEQVIAGTLAVGDYYIDQEKFESLKSCAVSSGDLLISLVGSFGKILVVPHEFEPGIINPRLLKLTPDQDKVSPEFLKHYFQVDSLQKHLKSLSHGGTMGILNAGLIKQLIVPIPPISKQREFVRILEKISSQLSDSADSEKRIEALFESLQQSAFSSQAVKGC